jgi:hypothetical protein
MSYLVRVFIFLSGKNCDLKYCRPKFRKFSLLSRFYESKLRNLSQKQCFLTGLSLAVTAKREFYNSSNIFMIEMVCDVNECRLGVSSTHFPLVIFEAILLHLA